MGWYPTLVFYFGVFDAGLIMLGGLFVAVLILLGKDWRGVFERVGPALGTIIGSNIAAALILGATKWLMG
ncbi:hypothetical protein [Bradyrhizobium paxllaeri]|uniref:hypothetical protein n=1 Tax=Bradyrhizobium paxllaeri TaxID=190148 RepID=UPI000810C3A1|nr:hypothetical protein [Bradyrhizobium paxllaeri]